MSKKNLNIRNRNKYAFSKKMKPIRNRYLKQDNATNNKKNMQLVRNFNQIEKICVL